MRSVVKQAIVLANCYGLISVGMADRMIRGLGLSGD